MFIYGCHYVIFEASIANYSYLANLEVKSKAPNGVTFTVKGKSAHEGPIAGQVRLCRAHHVQSTTLIDAPTA